MGNYTTKIIKIDLLCNIILKRDHVSVGHPVASKMMNRRDFSRVYIQSWGK